MEKNTYRGEDIKKGEERMTKLMMKLRASGYTRSQRWEILKSGSRRYKRMAEDEDRGVRRINRPRWEGGRERFIKKVLTKKNWFKKKSNSNGGAEEIWEELEKG